MGGIVEFWGKRGKIYGNLVLESHFWLWMHVCGKGKSKLSENKTLNDFLSRINKYWPLL